jgi:hypothetical protein
MVATIPVLDAGRRGALGLYEAASAEAAQLVAEAMAGHPLLALVGRLGDLLSKRWLLRRRNPFYAEIAAVAEAIGRPGVYLLNICYEWACSTSVGPDPGGDGNRMIRTLDWGIEGIGRHLVIGRHETDQGPYYNASWPGYAGILTAMAPGRFSAAINQAPRREPSGLRLVDEVIVHLDMYRSPGTLPATHLLRRAFEEAPNYDAALALLAQPIPLAMPAFFTLSGVRPEDGAVIEAVGAQRRVHSAAAAPSCVLGVANDWLSSDLPGVAREATLDTARFSDARASNAERRRQVCELQAGAFGGAMALSAPALNPGTIMVASANAREGRFTVEGLDCGANRGGVPRPISRGEIVGPPP